MIDKCSSIHQGYPSITTHTDCTLANTGSDLIPLTMLALMLVVAGLIIVFGSRFGEWRRRRRKLRMLQQQPIGPDDRIRRQRARERARRS